MTEEKCEMLSDRFDPDRSKWSNFEWAIWARDHGRSEFLAWLMQKWDEDVGELTAKADKVREELSRQEWLEDVLS